MRFVKGLCERGHKVFLATSGLDDRGERVLEHPNFDLAKLVNMKFEKKSALESDNTHTDNKYFYISSSDKVAPFGEHNKKVMLRKWFSFVLNYLINIYYVVYCTLKYHRTLVNTDAIIGYEADNAFAAKLLSVLFGKKYINKYQGTVLKGVERNVSDAIKYYPILYFGINKSDLCLMVNDGTDGRYWAGVRGCENIYFEPHGVAKSDYENNKVTNRISSLIANKNDKLLIFNNASSSNWKRVDRVVNILEKVEPKIRDKLHVYSTFFGSDLELIKELAVRKGVNNHISFVHGFNHLECNQLLRACDLLIMTNDMSNLGNPVLEAAYYSIPFMTIDDNSLDGVINDGSYISIKLNEKFDEEAARRIEELVSNHSVLSDLSSRLTEGSKVRSVEHQQARELDVIENVFI